MSFKQTDFCYECKEQPDNLLSLQCGHDLCLNCSSLQYYKFSYRKKNFMCQICGKPTPLDHSSIYELEKLIISHPPEENIKQISRDDENRRRNTQERVLQDQSQQAENIQNIRKGSYNQQQSSKISNNDDNSSTRGGWKSNNQRSQYLQEDHYLKQQQQQHQNQHQQYQSQFQHQSYISQQQHNQHQSDHLQDNEDDREFNKQDNSRYQQISFIEDNTMRLCREHDDEEVNYFCFDCKSNCICPECIIHGVHRDHNVKTIKKSYPVVKQLLEDYRLDLENSIIAISNKKESVYQQKSEIQTIQKNLKLEITTVFNVLKQKVDETCQQLIQQTEEIAKKTQRDLDETIKQIDKHILSYKKNEESITEQLRIKEEFRLLNYYGSNSKSIDEKVLLNSNNNLQEQFQIAKQIFSNHIHKKNQFLNIKSLIEDQIFELQNIEKKFNGSLSTHQYSSSLTEEQEPPILKEIKKLNTTQDKYRDTTTITADDMKKYDMIDKKFDILDKKQDGPDKKYTNATQFISNLQSQESLGISRQLDQDFERMKENLKKSSKYRASSLKKSENNDSNRDQHLFTTNFNFRNNRI